MSSGLSRRGVMHNPEALNHAVALEAHVKRRRLTNSPPVRCSTPDQISAPSNLLGGRCPQQDLYARHYSAGHQSTPHDDDIVYARPVSGVVLKRTLSDGKLTCSDQDCNDPNGTMNRWEDPATGRSYLICNRTGASYSASSSRLVGFEPDWSTGAVNTQVETSHAASPEHAFVDRSHLRRHEKRRGMNLDREDGMDEDRCPEWIGHVMKVRYRTSPHA